MYCARIDHFARFNQDGTVRKCGHMIDAPNFVSWQEMQDSQWLANLRDRMSQDRWPIECVRCRDTEPNHSVRLASNQRHAVLQQERPDYIILGGILDNVCNSACQSCNADLSTKIGSLSTKHFKRIDNYNLLPRIPLDRVVELDINGGEPTASPRYQELLRNLPPHVSIVRVNTNGSRILPNIQHLLDARIQVIITLSLDGTNRVHDYVRWPIRWYDYEKTVQQYKVLRTQYKNLMLQTWTVVHALNAMDFENILAYARGNDLSHSWALLHQPSELDPRSINHLTVNAKHHLARSSDPDVSDMARHLASQQDNQGLLDNFIQHQDRLRNIHIDHYL